jgi:hypothetical protein
MKRKKSIALYQKAVEMIPGGPFIGVVKQRHRGFFQRPRARRLEVAVPQRLERIPCGIRKVRRVAKPQVFCAHDGFCFLQFGNEVKRMRNGAVAT